MSEGWTVEVLHTEKDSVTLVVKLNDTCTGVFPFNGKEGLVKLRGLMTGATMAYNKLDRQLNWAKNDA